MPLEQQLILLFSGRNGYLDKLTLEQVDEFKDVISDWFSMEEDKMALENLFELEDEIVRDLTLDYIVIEIVNDILKN